MRRSITSVAVAVLALVVVVVGCDSASSGGGTPVQTTIWEQDGTGFYEFSTNDSQYYNYGFPGPISVSVASSDPETFEIEIKKESGATDYPYGMVFDYADSKNRGMVFITLNGSYSVRRSDNGTWTEITDPNGDGYKSSAALNATAGAVDRIKVVLNRNNDTLDLYLNGTLAEDDLPYEGDDHGAAEFGGYAVVGMESAESFPNIPVDVRFKALQPVTAP